MKILMKLAMGEEMYFIGAGWRSNNRTIIIIFVEHYQEEHTESWQKNNTKY